MADRHTVALDPAQIWIDALAFERLATKEGADALGEAAHLYGGDLLVGYELGEEGFDAWLWAERERLRDLACRCLARLAGHLETAGDTDDAVKTLRRASDLNVLDEEVHRGLMRLYLRRGQRGLALRQYHACHRILRDELNVTPEAETTQLYEITVAQAAATETVGAAGARSDNSPPALAVLPFSLSADVGDRGARFARSLHDDLVAALTGWRLFPIIDARSLVRPPDKNADIRDVALETGASYIVDGQIEMGLTSGRLTVGLVDGATGQQLWADQMSAECIATKTVLLELAYRLAATL